MCAMRRTLTAHLDLTLSGRTKLVYAVAAASSYSFDRESLELVINGTTVEP